MKYLLPIEYTRFIYYVIINELNIEQTSFYFWSQHKTYFEHNQNFINELRHSIDLIDKKRKKIIKESNDDLKLNGIDCFIDTDVLNGKIPFDSLHYQTEFINGNWEVVSEFSEEAILSNENLPILREGFELFEKYVINKEVPKNNIPTTPILTLTQRIHLLKKLGFFELNKVKELNDTQKGHLVSLLLQSSYKNTYDKIRERLNEKTIKLEIEKLNNILVELGLEKL